MNALVRLALGLLLLVAGLSAHARAQVTTASCGGVPVPAWQTANRPSAPADQMVGYNQTGGYCETYQLAGQYWSPTAANTVPKLGTTLQFLGDSFGSNNNYYYPASFAPLAPYAETTSRSYLAWWAAYSKGAIDFNLARGYAGPNQGVTYFYIRSQTQGCTSPPTVTVGGNATATANIAQGPGSMAGTNGYVYSWAAGQIIPDGLSPGNLPYMLPTSYGSGYTTVANVTTSGGGCQVQATIDMLVGSDGTIGVPGQNSTQILFRLPDAIATGVSNLVIGAGGNDCTSGIPPATTLSNIIAMVQGTLKANIQPILMSLNPKIVAGLTGAQTQACARNIAEVNRLIGEYAKRTPAVIYFDMRKIMGNPANSIGGAASYWEYDQAHLATYGATQLGAALWAFSQNLFAQYVNDDVVQMSGNYDATANPYGNLLTNGMLAGYGEIVGGVTSSGSASCTGVPTFTFSGGGSPVSQATMTGQINNALADAVWTLTQGVNYSSTPTVAATGGPCGTEPSIAVSMIAAGSLSTGITGNIAPGWATTGGSTTGTRVLSKRARADGNPGEEQVVTLAGLTGGASAETMQIYEYITPGTTPGLNVGSTIFFECDFNITSPQQILGAWLTMASTISGGGGNYGCLVSNETNSLYGLPNGVAQVYRCRTPDHTVLASESVFYPAINISYDASGTNGTGSGVVAFSRCGVFNEPVNVAGIGGL